MLDGVRELLAIRNDQESKPFETIIETVADYAAQLEDVWMQVENLKETLKRTPPSTNGTGSTSTLASASEQVVKTLKEERTELYRQQSLQATQLLALSDQLRAKDSVLQTLQNDLHRAQEELKSREGEMQKLGEGMREGERAVQIVKDELVALQLELLRATGIATISLNDGENDARECQKQRQEQGDSNSTEQGNSSLNGQDSLLDSQTQAASSHQSSPANCPQVHFTAPTIPFHCEKEILAPHKYPISSVASCSAPKHRLLLTGSEDQKICCYDLTRIAAKAVLKWSQVNGPIIALAIGDVTRQQPGHQPSVMVASTSAYDSEIVLWNLESGKVINSLPFKSSGNGGGSTSNSTTSPSAKTILQFGQQFRLWMAQGNQVRLWDTQRGLLLRSWGPDQLISSNFLEVLLPDPNRPDKVFLVDCFANFCLLNAVSGKLERPWEALPCRSDLLLINDHPSLYFSHTQTGHLLVASHHCILGYRIAASGGGLLEASFSIHFNQLFPTPSLTLQQISALALHPTRTDILAICVTTGPSRIVAVVRISPDMWAPRLTIIQSSDANGPDDWGTICWGPEEIDPITNEADCKLVVIAKESKRIRLYTLKIPKA